MNFNQSRFDLNWVAFKTLVDKEIRRFLRIWIQTLTPPTINAVLYFLIFGQLIGSRVGEMGGHSYMNFIVPGIVMMSVILNSYNNVVSSFYGSKFQHYIEELLISPVNNVVILAGFIVGGMARGLLVGGLVLSVALLFTDLTIENPGVTLLVALLTSALFAMGGLVNAIFANSFDDITIVPNFILTPLTYLGGIFYSVQMLPDFWETASKLNPILYMVNGFRYGILGSSDIDLVYSIFVICIFLVLMSSLALYLLEKGVRLKA